MPKRSYDERIKKYQTKIKKLMEKEKEKRERDHSTTALCSASVSENKLLVKKRVFTVSSEEEKISETCSANWRPDPLVTANDVPRCGEKIHDNLARLWHPILQKGLFKNCKEALKSKYQIPENCSLLQAPKLNPAIAAVISDAMKNDDKKMEEKQQQLALGISALNRGMTFLLGEEEQKQKAINFFCDSCRLLSDLHFMESERRREAIMGNVNEPILNIIQGDNRDGTLFE